MLRMAVAVGLMVSASIIGAGSAQGAVIALGNDGNVAAALTANGVIGGERWVAQARIGGPSTYEVGLHTAPLFTGQSPVAGGSTELSWVDGVGQAFTLSRTGSAVTFAMGGYSATVNDALANTLLVRLQASFLSGAPRTTSVSLTAPWVTTLSSTDGALNWLLTGLEGDFAVTGNIAFDWTNARPSQSQMAVQFKAFEGPTVPEPTTLLLMGAALGGLALRRRRA